MEFKAGDKIRCIDDDGVDRDVKVNEIYTIRKVDDHYVYLKGKDSDGDGFFPSRFEVVTSAKPKRITHAVIWEEDSDPIRYFGNETEAKDFIKELSEKSDVNQDTIILLEVKSAKKVSISKNVRLKEFKTF